ncbi:MAG: hypothetical protein IJ218_06175 [Alphaproteobacteria bacterium]|nr:hypothetical protein [Alphaproteobacteria bacterium]
MAAKNFDKNSRKNSSSTILTVEEESESWFANGLHLFIIGFSLIWFGIVAVYISKFFGWDKLFSMLPSEFITFMTLVILPLAIMWVIMAYIDRGSSFKNETRMLRDSLNQVIFPDSNGTEATKMIANAIKEQVAELKETTRDVCAQSDVIKRDLTERVADLRTLSDELDKYSSQTMQALGAEIQKLIENFAFVADKASAATADFRVNTLQMREDSEKLVSLMTPMVNEMVTAAERVKEVVNVNNDNIAKAQEQLNQYSESSQLAIGKIIESWAVKGENLEKTYLRTSENCEELFRRLDSGISHIENSIKEQKQVVETQSGLIDKNSTYLDNKLGEYGRLISLEVEAMVERSNTLERNVQEQLKSIRNTSEQVSEAFTQLGEDVAAKRKQLESESQQIVNNLNTTVNQLGEEMRRMQDLYGNAKSKNDEFNQSFAAVAQNLHELENALSNNINNFSTRAEDAVSRFNEVNQRVGENIGKLVESADNISSQSRNNAEMLMAQDDFVNKAILGFKQIAAQIAELTKNLHQTGGDIGTTLANYENKMSGFGQMVTAHLDTLQNGYQKAEKQYEAFRQRLKSASVDTFMRNSNEMFHELETMSIDINTMFNPSEDEELWKKYYEGDHAVFARHLAKNMTKKQVTAIQKNYETKSDFRILADKYMEDFAGLVAAARESEHAGTLLALISGSDIGKIYYILARALGKIN